MEEEVEKLMTEAFSKNFIDYEEYPQSAEIQNRCVNMIGRLFNAPTAKESASPVGTSTVGSSEAIMLSVLAMKKRWQNKRKAEGKDWHNPNIIMSSAVQVCWEKAARYFEVEEKYVYCTPDRFVIDPEETVNLVDENTVSFIHESSEMIASINICRLVSVLSLVPPILVSMKTPRPSTTS